MFDIFGFQLSTSIEFTLALAVFGGIIYFFGKIVTSGWIEKADEAIVYIQGIAFVFTFIVFPLAIMYYITQNIPYKAVTGGWGTLLIMVQALLLMLLVPSDKKGQLKLDFFRHMTYFIFCFASIAITVTVIKINKDIPPNIIVSSMACLATLIIIAKDFGRQTPLKAEVILEKETIPGDLIKIKEDTIILQAKGSRYYIEKSKIKILKIDSENFEAEKKTDAPRKG